MRGEGVPTPGIVATDVVAVGPTVTPKAPPFPGVDEEATPIFDQVWGSEPFVHLGAEIDAMDAMLAEQFPSWGLDQIAPLPIESLIKELKTRVDPAVAWTIEESVGAQALFDKIKNVVTGEEDTDGDDTAGPAGDPDVADPAEGPTLVGGDGPHDPGDPRAS